jgi:hypothetical protein
MSCIQSPNHVNTKIGAEGSQTSRQHVDPVNIDVMYSVPNTKIGAEGRK